MKSVVVFDNLHLVAYDNDQTIPRHVFESSVNFSNQILRFSDFQNSLVYVNKQAPDLYAFIMNQICHNKQNICIYLEIRPMFWYSRNN